MRVIALHPEPVITAADIHEELDLRRASALARLNTLADEGYLEKKQVGSSAVVFWMTDLGREKLNDAI